MPLLKYGACPPPQGNCYHTGGSLAEFVNALKFASSRRMRKLIATELDHHYWKPYFWSLSYFIGSVSDRTEKTVKNYIQNQKDKD